MKLNNIRLCVTKFRECFFFDRDILGFKVLWGNETSAFAEFDTGLSRLALFHRELMAQSVGVHDLPLESKSMDPFVLIFEVDQVDRKYKELQDKGITFITEPTVRENWGMKVSHFRDPQGNMIEIYEGLE
ncbi:VOC family protein [Shimazuella kribbensis]|uniref:VOC family protein n=1 Tax=Shimazuella kribbensis TaxID=139808 RepID=UPI00048D7AF1|nr:VOC family protein [Shimazuella kribbensis]